MQCRISPPAGSNLKPKLKVDGKQLLSAPSEADRRDPKTAGCICAVYRPYIIFRWAIRGADQLGVAAVRGCVAKGSAPIARNMPLPTRALPLSQKNVSPPRNRRRLQFSALFQRPASWQALSQQSQLKCSSRRCRVHPLNVPHCK